ncbi:hypothetical protein JOC85_002343 [Bacillus mesophilus]|uniref:Uncharacterized protein n=1 Tax=Bacillus mesophilus TaxID=1808955 RepID=A0A6M0Q8Y7_9BACI|nr:hypothetical protein [Bacillus mesophilus]MBM7661540.1 hypothetical protein [Bacillus mesophilus]NEY72209.1 hypothetical protein [Bacillus mesophilus]
MGNELIYIPLEVFARLINRRWSEEGTQAASEMPISVEFWVYARDL